MSTKKIIFPTDFSTASDAALPHAAAIAKENGATLVILHVEEPPSAYGGGELYYGMPDPDSAVLEEMLAKVVPSLKVPVEHKLVLGDPAAEIVRIAESENADMIVMGTHGRTGFLRLLMGSVAEEVVRKAPCPVLVYKVPTANPAAKSGK